MIRKHKALKLKTLSQIFMYLILRAVRNSSLNSARKKIAYQECDAQLEQSKQCYMCAIALEQIKIEGW